MFKYLPLLIDSFKYEFQQLLLTGAKYQYIDDNEQLFDFAKRLLQSAVNLEKRQSKAFGVTIAVNDILNQLKVCSLTDIASTTESLQKIVDQLQLQSDNYHMQNVWMWINRLNNKIDNILLKRMNQAIIEYKKIQTSCNSSKCASNIDNTIHKIDMIFESNVDNDEYNYDLLVEPNIAEARLALANDLYSHVEIFSNLKKIMIATNERNVNINIDDDNVDVVPTFMNILTSSNFTKSMIDNIIDCYQCIEINYQETKKFIEKCLLVHHVILNNYTKFCQNTFESIDKNINQQIELLTDMKHYQNHDQLFDQDINKNFGGIKIEFKNSNQMLRKVDAKYCDFRKKLFLKLREQLNEKLRQFFSDVTSSKSKLGDMGQLSNIEYGKIPQCLEVLKQLNHQSQEWRQDIVIYNNGQELLKNNRYRLFATWIYTSRIIGNIQDFEKLLFKRMTNAFKLSISWDIERLIWIGYYKYYAYDQNIYKSNNHGKAKECLFGHLPKDIVCKIIKLLKYKMPFSLPSDEYVKVDLLSLIEKNPNRC